MSTNQQTIATSESLPKKKLDYMPLLLIPLVALVAVPFMGNLPTWATLTVAGIGMGLIIFLMASGFSLVFGLMDVMNFGHGIFITLGAYLGISTLAPLQDWYNADSIVLNMVALAGAAGVGMLVTAIVGLIFERVIVRPVYGSHLTQILVTSGGMIVAGELIIVFWGPEILTVVQPPTLVGAISFGDFSVEKFRLMTMIVGFLIFGSMMLLLNRTKLGLLIRAGVQDREMVEALGYKVRFLFVSVFAAGAALAALGGFFYGLFQNGATVGLGSTMMVLIFIVIIIAGMGSIGGALIGSILVGLVFNYTNFAAPTLGAFSNIILMCLVILWRPQGLYPVAKR